MHYLDTIAEQLRAAVNKDEEKSILGQHPRWQSLCKIYDKPDLSKPKPTTQNERTLAARMTVFTFYMTQADLRTAQTRAGAHTQDLTTTDSSAQIVERCKFIPRAVNIYRLKGIVGRLFSIRPMYCKLIWETGEWDPIAGGIDDGWSVSEDDDSGDDDDKGGKLSKGKDRKRWQKREVELVDGTREVGFWVEGKEAKVRVEPREL